MESERRDRWVMFSVVALLVSSFWFAATATPAWADPGIAVTTANPTQIPIGQKRGVTVTAQISNVASTHTLTANLYRVNTDGTETKLVQLKDDGSKPDLTARDGLFAGTQNFNEPTAGRITLKVVVTYVLASSRSVVRRVESATFQIVVGGTLPPNTGGTIQGSGGTQVVVPPNAIPYPVLVSIATLPTSAITAPADPNLPLFAAVKLEVEPNGYVGELPPPSLPLQVSVPAPGLPDGGEYILAQQIVFESISLDGSEIVVGPQIAQLRPVAMATVIGGRLVTQPGTFDGAKVSGTYAFVEACCSAIVTGTVTENNVAQEGVLVANSSNTLITLTSPTGAYTLFLSTSAGNSDSVIAFHPLRGSAAGQSVNVTVDGQTITQNITLTPLSPALNVRRGIRNAGFERRDANFDCLDTADSNGDSTTGAGLNGWKATGSVRTIRQFGPTAAFPAGIRAGNNPGFTDLPAHNGGVTILPSEGKCMAAISTGAVVGGQDEGGVIAASLSQSFTIPPGATRLRLDYNYISEELPEWAGPGTAFQDPFRIRVIPSAGAPVDVAVVRVTDVFNGPGFEIIGDCGFPEGDDTCGQSGWRTVEANLTAFAGTNVTIQLLFDVADNGDSIFTTQVLIDNLRFSTVWLDVKEIAGASNQGMGTVAARLERDVIQANEVLSQAGINVRVRGHQSVNNPTLLDVTQKMPHDFNSPTYCTDGNGNIRVGADGVNLNNQHLEPEEVTLMNVNRSGLAGAPGGTFQDVNLYYVVSSNVSGALGWSANPGDFCQEVSIGGNVNWGTLLTDSASTRTLTHELGHQLIPAISGSPGTIMHNCASAEGTCFTASGAPATAIVTPLQSQAINGVAPGIAVSPLLKP